jgi:hypothetical protein
MSVLSSAQSKTQLDQEQRGGATAAALAEMGNHPRTLTRRHLTVDEALHRHAHATVTDEPHHMGNPSRGMAHPGGQDAQTRQGWSAGPGGFPFS